MRFVDRLFSFYCVVAEEDNGMKVTLYEVFVLDGRFVFLGQKREKQFVPVHEAVDVVLSRRIKERASAYARN